MLASDNAEVNDDIDNEETRMCVRPPMNCLTSNNDNMSRGCVKLGEFDVRYKVYESEYRNPFHISDHVRVLPTALDLFATLSVWHEVDKTIGSGCRKYTGIITLGLLDVNLNNIVRSLVDEPAIIRLVFKSKGLYPDNFLDEIRKRYECNSWMVHTYGTCGIDGSVGLPSVMVYKPREWTMTELLWSPCRLVVPDFTIEFTLEHTGNPASIHEQLLQRIDRQIRGVSTS